MMIYSLKEKKESCSIDGQSEGNNCCTPQPKGKVICPECGQKAKGVLGKTLQHLLREEAKQKLSCFDGFYYCKTATCKVVYFRGDEILTQKDIRVVVGLKEGAKPATVCYCFEWTKEKIKAEIEVTGGNNSIRRYQRKNKKSGLCL